MGGGVWNKGGDGLMVAGREEVKTDREHSEKGEFTKVPLRVCIKTAAGSEPRFLFREPDIQACML